MVLRLFLAVFLCKENPRPHPQANKPRLPAPTTAEPAPVAVSSSTTGPLMPQGRHRRQTRTWRPAAYVAARQQLQKPRTRPVLLVPHCSLLLLLLLLYCWEAMKADVVGAEQTTDRNSTKTTLSTRGRSSRATLFRKQEWRHRRPKVAWATSVKNWIELGLDVTNTSRQVLSVKGSGTPLEMTVDAVAVPSGCETEK
jgi:hypothetical protein